MNLFVVTLTVAGLGFGLALESCGPPCNHDDCCQESHCTCFHDCDAVPTEQRTYECVATWHDVQGTALASRSYVYDRTLSRTTFGQCLMDAQLDTDRPETTDSVHCSCIQRTDLTSR